MNQRKVEFNVDQEKSRIVGTALLRGAEGISRRDFLRISGVGLAGAALLGVVGCGGGGGAQEYPANRITMIVPYPAGSSPDLVARAVASSFDEKFDPEIIVENAPGGAAIPGTTRVVNSEPDGYTLGLLTTGSQVIAPLVSEASYTYKDFTYIGTVAERPSVFAVPGDSPYDTIEQFFEAAKENPGELSVATAGPSVIAHIKLGVLQEEYDVPLNPTPFDGGSETIPAVLGGNTDALFADPVDNLVSLIEEGRLKALATDAPEGLKSLSDVPTFESKGYEQLSIGVARFYIAGPADMPSEVKDALEPALKEALKDSAVTEQIGEQFVPEEFISGDEIRKDLQEAQDLYKPIVTDSG